MKSTLANNKQLFNVKAIATAGLTPENIPANTLGFIDMEEGSGNYGKTVVPVNFAAIPAEFRVISKLGGKLYYSFDNIEKDKIKNLAKQDYKASQGEIWKAVIDCCKCINDMNLNVGLDVPELVQETGLTWTHNDFHFVVSTEEMKCHCSCDGTAPVHENNVMTQLLVDKINADKSLFYTAEVRYESETAIPVADPAGGDGDIYFATNDLTMTVGGSAVVIGTKVDANSAVVTDVDAFVAQFKEANTAGVPANYGPMLTIVIKGTVDATPMYRDLDEEYVYPRGAKLTPSLSSSGGCVNPFEKVQSLVYELGAGYDMRAEEFDNMSYYTNLVHYQNSRGIADRDLVYQFENATNYNVINLEFLTDKTERNNGDKRLFGVTFGTSVAGVYTTLKSMFGL